ncbi:polysaccharide deacetylase family protein [Roseateles saccharophilus]|uniref:polysaccharide deacetylase family protein n=1 Tax=Roseateles saccharophilus TaxID=304 RepID=UPI001050F52D|nr:polysaccharide deacetylase family protein [Roseateles saccharophilus]MDG0832175.1 polysaccharide deacetylase family protein [Roseateles saccharophilus]
MKTIPHLLALSCLAWLLGPASAAPQAATPPAAPSSAPSAPAAPASAASAPERPHHNHAIEIRAARVRGLAEQMNQPAEALKQSCRFESDIGTPPPSGVVSLSFDDGPEPGATEAILALLDKHQIPASFFLIAAKVQRHPELAALVKAHPLALVGNHSWSHPNFHDIPAAKQASEVERSDTALAALAAPKLFRYPYGNSSCETNAELQQLGYRIVGWHVDSCDWAFDKTGSIDAHEAKICGVDKVNREHFVDHVVAAVKARKGGIVLMHEIHPNTLAKLEALIERLLAEGFRFAPLTDPGFAASLR